MSHTLSIHDVADLSIGEATDRGEVLSRSGWHRPSNTRPHCGCELTTREGAYRDMKVGIGPYVAVFYHQSPVVVTDGRQYRLDSCGWPTRSTKDRITSTLPPRYRVRSRDGRWVVETPTGDHPFEDGMVIGRSPG